MKFQEGTGSWGEAVKIYRQPEVIDTNVISRVFSWIAALASF